MKATCPVCGYYGALEGFVALEEYKHAIGMMAELGGDDTVKLLVRYLGLFRKPKSDRALTGARVLRLIRELRQLMEADRIQWKQQRIHENRRAYWMQAMQRILDRADRGQVERPLANHNLLRCIAYEVADKAFEAALREKEQELRYRPDAGRRRPDPDADTDRLAPEAVADLAKKFLEGRGGNTAEG